MFDSRWTGVNDLGFLGAHHLSLRERRADSDEGPGDVVLEVGRRVIDQQLAQCSVKPEGGGGGREGAGGGGPSTSSLCSF